jgi:DNA-binding transcriptional regulator YdaS (Cro superfamily)
MNYEQSIEYFGTESEMARALGVKPPSVSEWKRGIPETRQYQIELATKGKLKADRPALRISKKAA